MNRTKILVITFSVILALILLNSVFATVKVEKKEIVSRPNCLEVEVAIPSRHLLPKEWILINGKTLRYHLAHFTLRSSSRKTVTLSILSQIHTEEGTFVASFTFDSTNTTITFEPSGKYTNITIEFGSAHLVVHYQPET